MDRRTFIGTLAYGVVAVPLAVRAETATEARRIGWLAPGAPWPAADLQEAYAPLREFGWIVGKNLIVEWRYAGNRSELLRPLAEELVRLNLDLVLTEGTDATLAARAATSTTPIVFRSAGDPVGAGLVASLPRPGGNITGYSIVGPEREAKRLALLRELLPAVERVGVLANSTDIFYRASRNDFERACRSLRIQPIFVEVSSAGELPGAIADLARKGAQALIVQNNRLFDNNHAEVMRSALRYALPTVADGEEFLQAGALLSYDFNLAELRRRGAAVIDKILRGAKPSDIPIEQPTKFDVGINLKTAKALGITVPQSLLLRADEVIR